MSGPLSTDSRIIHPFCLFSMYSSILLFQESYISFSSIGGRLSAPERIALLARVIIEKFWSCSTSTIMELFYFNCNRVVLLALQYNLTLMKDLDCCMKTAIRIKSVKVAIKEGKETQKTLRKTMYEKFSAPSTESLDSISLMDFSKRFVRSQIPDKSRKGLGFVSYNAVPPPPIGLFSPPNLDLSYSGLEEFQQPEFEGYGPKPSKSVSEDTSNKVKESPEPH
ncbi:hypothetical protein Tco_0758452 [Tanacetum coccineum]